MKKLLAIVLAAAMLCAAMLTMLSCDSDSTKTEETTAADTKTTLIMATNANFPPYEYKEGNGMPVSMLRSQPRLPRSWA